MSTDVRFFDGYDLAVIGTVTEIATVREGGNDDGATTVSVDVEGVLGDAVVAGSIDTSA
jgi:hypothetical protein